MLQPGARLVHFQFASSPTLCNTTEDSMQQQSRPLSTQLPPQHVAQTPTQPSISFDDLLVKIRLIGGLRKEDIFCNLRVPNQLETDKDEVSLVLLTGGGVLCIDVKDWRGEAILQKENWHLKLKDEDQNLVKTSVFQAPDPIQAVTAKAANLRRHLQHCGVSLRPAHLLPRVILLSDDCRLSDELRKRKEVVPHADLDAFLCSFREGLMAWAADALTPSWLSGRLSYRQLREAREVLRRTGTWDHLRLRGGEQLRGDYRGCRHLAVDRQETEELEFSGAGMLAALPLWGLLGCPPQVTVKMYRRGGWGWVRRPTSGTATIPHNAQVAFRVDGEKVDTWVPVSRIRSISLSI